MSAYCCWCQNLPPTHLHRRYHDTQYGFPSDDDHVLFERLILEINQAGLSWHTILMKYAHFQAAYAQFDIQTVAHFDEADRLRLMNDTGIIRHRLKINAAIENAKRILVLQQQYGSFSNWLLHHHPQSLEAWVALFKTQFKFVGKEIVKEFLMSTSYLEGAHQPHCPIYPRTIQAGAKWAKIFSIST